MWLAVGGAVIVGGLLGSTLSWLLFSPVSPLALLTYLALSTAAAAGRLR